MPTSITYFPNGEYLQGHIPHKKRKRGEGAFGRYDVCIHPRLNYMFALLKNNADLEAAFGKHIQRHPAFATGSANYLVVGRDKEWYLLDVVYANGDRASIKLERSLVMAWHRSELAKPLGSSSADILATPKNRKKCDRLTKYMARNIRNGCYLMEQQYGNRNLSFLTLTVPTLSNDGYDKVSLNWGKLVNKFTKWLRKETLKREGYEQSYVYCTEIQEKRRKRDGVVCPHLHLVYRGRSRRGGAWTFTPGEIRARWALLLGEVCNDTFTTEALENLQQVKKSAGGYLAKYMGKGISASECPSLRTHWGGMSRNLSRLIKVSIQRWDTDGAHAGWVYAFINNQERLLKAGLIKYYKRTWIRLDKPSEGTHPSADGASDGIGIWVGGGCLSTTTYCGGVVKVLKFLGCSL